MTAFDTAWGIMKMPVVPNQLEYLGKNPNAGSFFTDTKRFKTLFQDPETQELLPLFVDYGSLNREGKKYESYKGAIGGEPRGEETFKLENRDEGDPRRAITGVNFHQGSKSRFPFWSETREGHRNKGYASALYDVIAHLMDKQGGNSLNPSDLQTLDGKNMWANKTKNWPVRDDL